jgi:hypothetical protein
MKHFRIIFLFSLFLAACISHTKSVDISTRIKEQAETMGQFILKSDYKSFAKFTYPKVLELMGGEKKMIELMENESKEMESEGYRFLKITIGEPSKIITIGNELQCTLPETIEMKVPNGKLVIKSTLIAISIDKGKNWYFVDTSDNNMLTLKKTLPNLSGELVIPEKQQPIFYNN